MNEKKQKMVKKMFTSSLIIFVVYMILGLIVCLQPKIFLTLFITNQEVLKNEVFDFYQIGKLLATGVMFFLGYFFSRKKVSDMSVKPTVLGILNIVMVIFLYFVIPRIALILSNWYAIKVILPQSEVKFSFFVTIAEMINFLNPLLFISIVMFLCGYVVYWAEVSCGTKIMGTEK